MIGKRGGFMTLLTEAIAFAAGAHDGVTRKGSRVPYIVHPMETVAIAASITDDEEVLAAAEDNLDEFELIADEVLSENGFDYTATAELAEMHFDKRVYGDLTVPEGDYTALRITLGSGEGHNWWCVMYPPLCLPCFADKSEEEMFDECGDYISDDEEEMLREPEKIGVKLYIVELIEKIAELFK